MEITFRCENGKLNIYKDNSPVYENVYMGFRADGETYISDIFEGGYTEDVFTANCEYGTMTVTRENTGVTVKSELRLPLDVSSLESVISFGATKTGGIGRYFGNIPYNANGTPMNEMQSIISCGKLKGKFTSGDFTAVNYGRKKGTLIGYVESLKYSGLIDIYPDGLTEAYNFTEYKKKKAGEIIRSESLRIDTGRDIHTLLESYSGHCADFAPNEPRDNGVPSGYCTWYYYHGRISEDIVLNALEDLKEVKDICPVKYFQVDDGWEKGWGDWEANERFPHGMKYIADRISEAGFVPGIWIAPFGMSTRAGFYWEHREECFARERDSDELHVDPFRFYDIDYSVDASVKYLEDLVHKITYDWGYEYIKVDIITATIGPNRYRDPEMTSIENHIKGMEIINRAKKPGTFILGCTEPFLSAVGMVDAMRVSVDIFEDFTAVRNVFNKVLNRYFYHHKLFVNDSDCIIVRNSAEEDDECDLRCVRSEEEIRTFVSAAMAAGGVLMLSDKLRLLGKEHMKLLSYLFPQNTKAGIPLDIGMNEVPELIDMGYSDGRRKLIILNWNDSEKTYSVRLREKYALEAWENRKYDIVEGHVTVTLPPHASRIFVFSDEEDVTPIFQ